MRAKPVRECIYCGNQNELTDEHVIPYGLGGELILPAASCKDCEKVTSKIEREVLRRHLIQVRSKLGMPSRRKSLPKDLPITVQLGGEPKTFYLPKAEHPTLVSFLLYLLPAALRGDAPEQGISAIGHQLYQIGGPPMKQVVSAKGSNRMTFAQKFVGNEFERMLAKIGLGWAVAELGVGAVRSSPLRGTILGTRDDAGHWVGTGLFYPPPSAALHEVKLDQADGWVIARIRLFAPFRTPEHIVVITEGDRELRPTVEYGDRDDLTYPTSMEGTLEWEFELRDRYRGK